jgi:hypothetical protein
VLASSTLGCMGPKCLIPFLPDLLHTLEEHGHAASNEEERCLFLSMSATTADRLLLPQWEPAARSLYTPKRTSPPQRADSHFLSVLL